MLSVCESVGLLTLFSLVRQVAASTHPVSLRVSVLRCARPNALNGCMLLVIRHPATEVTP
jgi:hypothetical protein